MSPIAIGSSETTTIPIVTSEKFCFTIGTLPSKGGELSDEESRGFR